MGSSGFEQSSERPSFIGQERASDRGGVTGESERGAGGMSSRHERSNENSYPNDRGSV
jgi:hypothetical protein